MLQTFFAILLLLGSVTGAIAEDAPCNLSKLANVQPGLPCVEYAVRETRVIKTETGIRRVGWNVYRAGISQYEEPADGITAQFLLAKKYIATGSEPLARNQDLRAAIVISYAPKVPTSTATHRLTAEVHPWYGSTEPLVKKSRLQIVSRGKVVHTTKHPIRIGVRNSFTDYDAVFDMVCHLKDSAWVQLESQPEIRFTLMGFTAAHERYLETVYDVRRLDGTKEDDCPELDEHRDDMLIASAPTS